MAMNDRSVGEIQKRAFCFSAQEKSFDIRPSVLKAHMAQKHHGPPILEDRLSSKEVSLVVTCGVIEHHWCKPFHYVFPSFCEIIT